MFPERFYNAQAPMLAVGLKFLMFCPRFNDLAPNRGLQMLFDDWQMVCKDNKKHNSATAELG